MFAAELACCCKEFTAPQAREELSKDAGRGGKGGNSAMGGCITRSSRGMR